MDSAKLSSCEIVQKATDAIFRKLIDLKRPAKGKIVIHTIDSTI